VIHGQHPAAKSSKGKDRARDAHLHASAGEAEEEPLANHNGDVAGEHREGEQTPSLRHRLRDRRAYWEATMHQMGLVCALTLRVSISTGGFHMDWDPDRGPAPPAFLCNHPSALEEAAFVTGVIASCIAASTMRACSRDELICILPLGVAFNSAMAYASMHVASPCPPRLAWGLRRAAQLWAALGAS
jgi:hypothetical protein